MRSLAILIALAAACSSPARRDTAGGGGATGGPPPDAPPATADDAGAATGALTRADCEAIIDHILAIGLEEQRRSKPADQVPTDDQVARIRADMVEEMMDQCLVWDRPSFDCIMAASSIEQMNACAGTPPAAE